MSRLDLNFYGITVRIECSLNAVLEPLRRDFHYFSVAELAAAPQIQFLLHLSDPPDWFRQKKRRLAINPFSASDSGAARNIYFFDHSAARYDYGAKTGDIFCRRKDRLRELGYLAVLSRVGEEFDRRGWHRIHALGFEAEGKGGLLLLPSGGGKSVMGLQLINHSTCGFFSDDTPLITNNDRVLAFPLPLGLKGLQYTVGIPRDHIHMFMREHHGLKWSVDLDYFSGRISSQVPVKWIIIGRRQGDKSPRMETASAFQAGWALLSHLILAIGTPQMREYMLRPRPSQLWTLAKIAYSRTRMALRLMRSAEFKIFVMGNDPEENQKVLLKCTTTETNLLDSGLRRNDGHQARRDDANGVSTTSRSRQDSFHYA